MQSNDKRIFRAQTRVIGKISFTRTIMFNQISRTRVTAKNLSNKKKSVFLNAFFFFARLFLVY